MLIIQGPRSPRSHRSFTFCSRPRWSDCYCVVQLDVAAPIIELSSVAGMSLFFRDDIVLDAAMTRSDRARDEFMAGIKAAFVVGQMNRLGQVLCGGCGAASDDLSSAFKELDVVPAARPAGAGYRGGLDWGDDHPGNLLLICGVCRSKAGLNAG